MDRQKLIDRFEAEMSLVTRPGVDKLMEYIRKSDFYTAPASTKYHLSCEGGLLQHSLNVLDALRGVLTPLPNCEWAYIVGGKTGKAVDHINGESVTIAALLHDICKTYFYTTSTRNVKNEQTGRWEKKPYYTVEDKMPLGHGPKSAMIVKQYMELTTPELYAIWHHMGYSDAQDYSTINAAIQKYPLIWALHTADVIAMSFMEAEDGNRQLFLEATPAPKDAAQDAAAPASEAPPMNDADAPASEAPPMNDADAPPEWEDAPALQSAT